LAPQESDKATKLWKWFHAARAIIWLALIPVAYFMDWIASVRFVSFASLYANVASDTAAFAGERNPNQDQLNRIEKMLEELLERGDSENQQGTTAKGG